MQRKNNISILKATLLSTSVAFLFGLGCTSDTKPATTDHQSALPHSKALPSEALSDADKSKLKEAKGINFTKVGVQDVEQMFDAASRRLHIFCFWKVGSKECTKNILALQEALRAQVADRYRLVLINIDAPEKIEEARFFVRTNNVFGEIYHLQASEMDWTDGIHPDWEGKLPATFFVNETEALSELYEETFDVHRAQAILEPLLL